MQAIYRSPGDMIDYTPTSDVSAGDVIVIGNMVCVAKAAIKADQLGALAFTGVFDFAREADTEFFEGDEVYWDKDGTSEAGDTGAAVRDADSGTNKYAGVCLEDTADDADHLTVRVLKLAPGASTDPAANTTAAETTTEAATTTAAETTTEAATTTDAG